jgi:PqqD family protein of HPr-rel-A system
MQDWGEEWVVFDGASGDCHLLSAACGAVLAELLHAPAEGLDRLQLFLRAFGDEAGAPSDDEMATLQQALERLQALGLVRATE